MKKTKRSFVSNKCGRHPKIWHAERGWKTPDTPHRLSAPYA